MSESVNKHSLNSFLSCSRPFSYEVVLKRSKKQKIDWEQKDRLFDVNLSWDHRKMIDLIKRERSRVIGERNLRMEHKKNVGQVSVFLLSFYQMIRKSAPNTD